MHANAQGITKAKRVTCRGTKAKRLVVSVISGPTYLHFCHKGTVLCRTEKIGGQEVENLPVGHVESQEDPTWGN